ncbi:MAG: hypothetical protein IJ658_11955 [Kiritimatiellae bacterium]|nr:hypothetical protein [Kiritimatiellia bacterium]
MSVIAIFVFCLVVVFIGFCFVHDEEVMCKRCAALSERASDRARGADAHGEPRPLVSLSCGAKIVQLEPQDGDDAAAPDFDGQPEAAREGGFFFQCHPRCPYILDCPRQKALAGFHLGEDVRVPLENGLFLELQRRDGHRALAVVGDPDVEFEPVSLAGVTFSDGGKRYTTVPPLMQQVEQAKKNI